MLSEVEDAAGAGGQQQDCSLGNGRRVAQDAGKSQVSEGPLCRGQEFGLDHGDLRGRAEVAGEIIQSVLACQKGVGADGPGASSQVVGLAEIEGTEPARLGRTQLSGIRD